MKRLIVALSILVASASTLTAAQFHETPIYKNQYLTLSKGEQSRVGLGLYIKHIYQNILTDIKNGTCTHRQDVDLDLVKVGFRYKVEYHKSYQPHYDRSLKKLKKLKLDTYKYCYQSTAKKRNPDWTFSISVTTREPREGEVDGIDYIFMEDEKFKHMAHFEIGRASCRERV